MTSYVCFFVSGTNEITDIWEKCRRIMSDKFGYKESPPFAVTRYTALPGVASGTLRLRYKWQ